VPPATTRSVHLPQMKRGDRWTSEENPLSRAQIGSNRLIPIRNPSFVYKDGDHEYSALLSPESDRRNASETVVR
jgi:hypothetical protein